MQLGAALFGSAAQIQIARSDFAGRIADLPCAFIQRPQHGANTRLQRLHGAQAFTQRRVAKAGGYVTGEVALAHALSARDEFFYKLLAGHGAVQVKPQHEQAHTQTAQDQRQLAPLHQYAGDHDHL